MNVFVYPPNSLILVDLIERHGKHKALNLMNEVKKRVVDPDIDSPPMNITSEFLKKGLDYVAVESPSGIRGRLALLAPLLNKAEAAIIVNNADWSFGCMGCARASNLVVFRLKTTRSLTTGKRIPILELEYPSNEKEAELMVAKIFDF